MPLTSLQKDVLKLLASHRSPESHVGGGVALNRTDTSPRFSKDIDVFHDQLDGVLVSAETDVKALREAGFQVEWLSRQAALQRATLKSKTEELGLDWCHDSAFRFLPAQHDAEFGYSLHPADVATNKALALANRSEVRDYVDILQLHVNYLSLGAICWAACGKDPGFTPWSLLEMQKRHVAYRQEQLDGLFLTRPLSLVEMKGQWIRAVEEAESLFGRLPVEEVGCLYLSADAKPCTPDAASADFAKLTRHFGSVRGSWPKVV